MSTNDIPEPTLADVYKEIRIGLELHGISCIQYQQQGKKLNILIQFSHKKQLSNLSSEVLDSKSELQELKIESVVFFFKNPETKKVIRLKLIDLNQSEDSSDNLGSKENNLSLSTIGKEEKFQGLSLKERIKRGDTAAIETVLDISLVSRGIKSSVILEATKARVILLVQESREFDRNSLVGIIKRQFSTNKPDSIMFVEVVCKKLPEEIDIWSELISLNHQSRNKISPSGVDKKTNFQDLLKVNFQKNIAQIPSKNILPLGIITAGSIVILFSFWSSLHSKVPDVIGTDINYARGIIQGKEFKVEVLEQVDENLKEGQIINQTPRPGKSLMRGKTIEVMVAKLPVYKIKGSFKLFDSDIGGRSENCYGTGGYSDIEGGMDVTVRDKSGSILASTSTSIGTSDDDDFLFSCEFKFTLEVPSSDFYSITIGRRGELNYSLSEMKEMSWNVSLFLGF
jgi:hypothetical protein